MEEDNEEPAAKKILLSEEIDSNALNCFDSQKNVIVMTENVGNQQIVKSLAASDDYQSVAEHILILNDSQLIETKGKAMLTFDGNVLMASDLSQTTDQIITSEEFKTEHLQESLSQQYSKLEEEVNSEFEDLENVDSMQLFSDASTTIMKKFNEFEATMNHFEQLTSNMEGEINSIYSNLIKTGYQPIQKEKFEILEENSNYSKEPEPIVPSNTEDSYPYGSWLGDSDNAEKRVRCAISPTELEKINISLKTPEKMAVKLLDYLFDRDTLATSNISGASKHGKKQLCPLSMYGIKFIANESVTCDQAEIIGSAIQISLNGKSLVDAKIPRSRQVLTLAAQSKESVTKIKPLYVVDSTVLFMRMSVLLERSACGIAVCGANVIVVSNDTDVKIMLLYLYNSEMGDIIVKPFGSKKMKSPDIDIGKTSNSLNPHVLKYLLVIQAFSGCDATSAIFDQGKTSIIKLVENSKKARNFCDISMSSNSTVKEVGDPGIGLLAKYIIRHTELSVKFEMNGTSSDLRSSATQFKFMQDRINNVENHFGEICQQGAAYARKNAKLRDKGDDFAKSILSYAETETLNKTTRYALTHFTDNLAAVQDYKQAEVHRLESNVIQELAAYGIICKQAKDDLKASFLAKQKELQQKKRLSRIRDRNPTNRQQIAETDLMRASTEASRYSEILLEQMDKFEKRKLSDVKRILLDFIKIEMSYHAKALELFTKANGSILSINEDDDLEEFRNCLRVPAGASRLDTVLNASNSQDISQVVSDLNLSGFSKNSGRSIQSLNSDCVDTSPSKRKASNADNSIQNSKYVRDLDSADEASDQSSG
ncbi:Protein FAM92A-A [Nymphon striatum]|nr:Protein FAM92A-A [Nymphon striatum]